MSKGKRVSLYEERGETSRFIDADIDDQGQLVLSGYDIGKAPLEFWGDSDCEFWVVIVGEHQDTLRRVL